jgi:1-phosphofructokinase family hexose kinase
MIVTLTPNTATDHTLFIPAWEAGKTVRATSSLWSMGGKASDASYILGELGLPSLALGFAAGSTGDRIRAMMESKGVTVDFTPVGGESRVNTIIIDEATGAQTTLTTNTLAITPAQVEALTGRLTAALEDADCLVLGGTLPPGLAPGQFAAWIDLARDYGVPVIFDASGPYLRAGIVARPTYIKPNRDELGELVSRPIHTIDDALHAGREILDRYGTVPIISLGSEGGLAVLPDKAYRIPPLPIQVVSAAGAGDGVLAGLAASIARGQPIEDGLRLGFACAAAVCLMPGTAECKREDVERLLRDIHMQPL